MHRVALSFPAHRGMTNLQPCHQHDAAVYDLLVNVLQMLQTQGPDWQTSNKLQVSCDVGERLQKHKSDALVCWHADVAEDEGNARLLGQGAGSSGGL